MRERVVLKKHVYRICDKSVSSGKIVFAASKKNTLEDTWNKVQTKETLQSLSHEGQLLQDIPVLEILFGFCLFSFGRCLDDSGLIKILRYDSDFNDISSGAYSFSYENSDHSQRQEFGHVLLPGTEDEHMKVNGSYSYVGPDGVTYTVRYTADDQGFHPEGDHIKVPPFVPWIHKHGKKEAGKPQYTSGERILDTYRSTPSPTTQYLPSESSSSYQSYTSGEKLLNSFRTTPKPTTQYLPLESKPGYITGENILSTRRVKPSTQYLPTSTPSYNNHLESDSTSKPRPEIILHSSPPGEKDAYYRKKRFQIRLN